MSTAQASNGIITTVNVKSVAGTSGNKGAQWQLQGCRYPWSNPNRPDIVSSLWIEQADYPEQPGPGMYRVEIVMNGMINKQDGSMYDGSRYWMHKYKCLRLIEPVNNMDASPDFGAAVDGFESTNNDTFTGKPDTPSGPTGGNYQSSSASLYTRDELIVRQVAAKGAFDMISAQIYMPESFDELLETFYHKIMGYTQPSVTDDVSMPAMEVNEAPAAPVPAAPVVKEHHCEKHGVDYGPSKVPGHFEHQVTGSFSNGTTVAVCHEGSDGIYDQQGNPVEAIL